ncbi:hypothetical protein [Mucilaginibacter sp.]|uniref:hypothetical protein n=1 Tax=Mucilaginibacter sp. TaxID=1882438 RepID=UPI003264407F
MLDIKFVPIKDSKKSYIVIDGHKDAEPYDENNTYREHRFQTKEVYDTILNYSSREIYEYFDEIIYYDLENPIASELSIFIHFYEMSFDINLNYSFYLNAWDKGFTFDNFLSVLESLLPDKYNGEDSKFLVDVENVVGLNLILPYTSDSISLHVRAFIEEINSLIKLTYLTLSANSEDSFISVFKFPESIKTPCQQYLMYFGQFLSDLGIEVETTLKEQAHSTLFSVTPKDKDDAMEKIKDVLEMYINLPNSDAFNRINNPNVALIQIQANVMHLNSQIMLAHATIQMKDATIEALKISNYQIQQQLYHQEIQKEEDEEAVIDGIISVKKYDGQWFSVNIPEILRKLKRKFK